MAREMRDYGKSDVHKGYRESNLGKDKTRMIQPSDVARVVSSLVTQSPTSFVSEILLRPTMKP